MQSAIYQGRVFHARHFPKKHAFNYDIFLMWLKLDEIAEIEQSVRFFSISRWAPLRFKRQDYLGDNSEPLQESVLKRMNELAGSPNENPLCGDVYLLGQVRTFGLYFSPVNFYYLRQSNGSYSHMLAEVSNTPWNQRHHYLVDLNNQQDTQKAFHVSPFNPLDMQYQWSVMQPNQKLNLTLKCVKNVTHLDTGLNLNRIELNSKSLTRVLMSIPSMALRTVIGIYWQAIKLFIKRVPFYAHATQGKK
ncbi:hypothetical protein FX988_01376 [Paraglaciecola mesophila]|uniref:DUF1365 domain-containing protein n=1 Tax=Paraglaciecola mesophila TaxID=197222 RepID=A0A857JIR8_9ALTE|nr:DUF1365 domain-containing protein [Paraglaciecola mesophila]QHJ11148.1 hypothetical protein FX988_01376 [Paraglaciecola mesophila]